MPTSPRCRRTSRSARSRWNWCKPWDFEEVRRGACTISSAPTDATEQDHLAGQQQPTSRRSVVFRRGATCRLAGADLTSRRRTRRAILLRAQRRHRPSTNGLRLHVCVPPEQEGKFLALSPESPRGTPLPIESRSMGRRVPQRPWWGRLVPAPRSPGASMNRAAGTSLMGARRGQELRRSARRGAMSAPLVTLVGAFTSAQNCARRRSRRQVHAVPF